MATHRERVIACADRPLVASSLLLPPPNRNRLLPISITLLIGRNPRIRGFGWGRVGVGGRWKRLGHASFADPHPRPLPTRGGGKESPRAARHAFRRVAILVALCVPLSGAIAPKPATAQPAAPQIQRAASGLDKSLDLQTELPVSSPEPDPIRINLPNVVRVLVWILVICGAASLAYFVRDILPAGGLARRSQWDDPSEPSALGRPQDGAAAQVAADDLARQGRFVEAMHVLLLQGLDEMRKRLDLRFADSLTSREIMRRASVSPGAKAALREIIHWVERAYFGSHPAVAGDYAACRQSFVAFAEALKQGTST
jgi:hypothetical protein